MPALTACSMPRIAGRAEAEQRQSPCEKAYFDATADNKIAHDQHQHIIRRYFSAQQAVSAWTNTAAQCPARFAEGTLRSAQARHMARALGDQLSVAIAPITLSRAMPRRFRPSISAFIWVLPISQQGMSIRRSTAVIQDRV